MTYFDELFGVAGKTALVTGGGSGIGRMMAEALVRGGARVLIASRKAEICEEVAAELNTIGPGTAEGFGGDVSSGESVTALSDAVKERTDHLHILINNAGISWGEPMESFPFEQWTRVMNVNAGAVFSLSRDMVPLMEAASSDDDPARIINIGSVMGTVPLAEGAYSYSASKAAVHHITRILATELAAKRITCNAFAPGPFPSRMTRFATGSADRAAQVGANVPLGRIGRPEDLAAATLFLCGRGGGYVSGAILPVDGGMSAMSPPNLFANIS
jgi:NAD(P)-dependent dehydrogenase (short-subunit alcohol dehydrogenase family)